MPTSSRRRARSAAGSRPTARRPSTAPAAADAAPAVAAAPPETGGVRATGILIRFVSCGLLSVGAGLAWRLSPLAPQRVGVGSTMLGILFLLSGFIAGGILWYVRDARLRQRNPALVSDERLVFSFVVFALMPFAVLIAVGLIYVLALIIGR